VIRLRRTLERGRKHPLLGPIVLILLVLLLAMVFLHAAHDDHGAAVETGFFCLAIVTMLGPVLVRVGRAEPRSVALPGFPTRGPPTDSAPLRVEQLARGPGWRVAPLRR
jgi:hypothetical protein